MIDRKVPACVYGFHKRRKTCYCGTKVPPHIVRLDRAREIEDKIMETSVRMLEVARDGLVEAYKD